MRSTLNRILALAGPVLATLCAQGQGTMNIEYPQGFVVLVAMDELDSVSFQAAPPPGSIILYRSGLEPESILVSDIDSITYSPGGPEGTAQLATRAPAFRSAFGATCSWFIGDQGDTDVQVHGICYGTSPLPDLSGASITVPNPAWQGTFQMQVNGLTPATTYYARAFATNAQGTSYGNQVSFSTLSIQNPGLTYGSVTDQSGNTYGTIAIGTQVWMAENLRATTYTNGDPIPHVADTTGWAALSTGAWVHVNNTPDYLMAYGRLYNWFAVTDPRNVCPAGWHVPSDAEWQTLETALGMPGAQLGQTGYRGAAENVGGMMKLPGQWTNPNTGANNSSGFSGLPAGLRDFLGTFVGPFWDGYWWTSSAAGTTLAWGRGLRNTNAGISREAGSRRDGFAVRCVMD
jgi:uncharacterized protein (TIGR02145 family)